MHGPAPRPARLLGLPRLLIVLSVLLGAGACGGGCGGGWSPAFEAGGDWYMNVGGSSASDVYAVGGTTTRGVVKRFDGERWTQLELGVDVPLLNWVHAFSPDDVWVVGNEGTLLHYDGAQWKQWDAPAQPEDPIWGVWGAAPDDVWAVGGSGFSQSRPLLFHFDGSAWSEVPLPALQRPNVFALYKVWGTSADNVLAVGQEGLLLRWNGSEWREEDAGARDDLISLWGTGPDEIVVVGGRGNGLVTVWNGTDWRMKSLSPLPGMNGVWMGEAGSAWIAGGQGTIARLDLQTLEATVEPEDDVGTTLELHAIFGVGDTLYAVGGNLLTGASTGRFEGVALERKR